MRRSRSKVHFAPDSHSALPASIINSKTQTVYISWATRFKQVCQHSNQLVYAWYYVMQDIIMSSLSLIHKVSLSLDVDELLEHGIEHGAVFLNHTMGGQQQPLPHPSQHLELTEVQPTPATHQQNKSTIHRTIHSATHHATHRSQHLELTEIPPTPATHQQNKSTISTSLFEREKWKWRKNGKRNVMMKGEGRNEGLRRKRGRREEMS